MTKSTATALPRPVTTKGPRALIPASSPEQRLLLAVFGQTSPKGSASARRSRATADDVARQASLDFVQAYRAEPMERVGLIKHGVPAVSVEMLARRMAMPKERLLMTLGLARATIERKSRENRDLSSEESSRVFGMAQLIGQVQSMVEESGRPEGFEAAEWVGRWLERPLPALGGRRPAELMDTAEGQGIVSNLVARFQSGAYA